MPNAVERVEEFLKAYGMSPSFTDVDACARAFQRDMERGLQGAKDAWMMMLPTYLSLEGEVPEEEPTIVIDAGGTNFRIGLVTVHPEGPGGGGPERVSHARLPERHHLAGVH